MLAAVVVCGCGRVGFDATSDGGDPSTIPRPIVRYLFDDDLADGAADSIGNRALGCDGPCPVSVNAVDGLGARFSGSLLRANGTGLATPQFSLAVWLQSNGPDACVFGKPYGAGTENSWQVCISGSGDLVVCTAPDGCDLGGNFGALAMAHWIGITVTYDGASVRAWIGGEQVIEAAHATVVFDDSDVVVGGDIDSGATNVLLDGAIDDIRIWDVALTPEQAVELVAP